MSGKPDQLHPACEDVLLGQGELEEYQVSHERFALTLRQLMQLEGAFQILDSTCADTIQLGELRAHDGVHDVFLSLGRWGWGCALGRRAHTQAREAQARDLDEEL